MNPRFVSNHFYFNVKIDDFSFRFLFIKQVYILTDTQEFKLVNKHIFEIFLGIKFSLLYPCESYSKEWILHPWNKHPLWIIVLFQLWCFFSFFIVKMQVKGTKVVAHEGTGIFYKRGYGDDYYSTLPIGYRLSSLNRSHL